MTRDAQLVREPSFPLAHTLTLTTSRDDNGEAGHGTSTDSLELTSKVSSRPLLEMTRVYEARTHFFLDDSHRQLSVQEQSWWNVHCGRFKVPRDSGTTVENCEAIIVML